MQGDVGTNDIQTIWKGGSVSMVDKVKDFYVIGVGCRVQRGLVTIRVEHYNRKSPAFLIRRGMRRCPPARATEDDSSVAE